MWDDTRSRGWAVEKQGHRLYYDSYHRQTGDQVAIDSFAAHPGYGKEPAPLISCQPINRKVRPLLSKAAELFVDLAGEHDLNGSESIDLAESLPGVMNGPFTLMFTARWDKLGFNNTILDFGDDGAENNIILAQCGSTRDLCLSFYDLTSRVDL